MAKRRVEYVFLRRKAIRMSNRGDEISSHFALGTSIQAPKNVLSSNKATSDRGRWEIGGDCLRRESMSTYEVVTAKKLSKRLTFSPAVRAGNLLFISGTTAVNDEGEIVGPGDIAAQARYIYEKFGRLLATVGAGFEHIVQTTEYITTTENYRKTADIRREVFKGPFPTATGVIVQGLLREGALIEISAVAVLPEKIGS